MFWGKKEKPKQKTLDQYSPEEIKEFQNGLKKQMREATREVDKSIFKSDMAIKECQRDLEKKIKEGANKNVLRVLAKNVLVAQKNKEKQMVSKTKLQSVEMNINQMVMAIKMGNVMGNAAKIAGYVNKMINIPELANTMAKMQEDFDKFGVVAEQMDDAMDNMDDNVESDVDVDKFIDRVADTIHGKDGKKVVNTNTNTDIDAALKNLTS